MAHAKQVPRPCPVTQLPHVELYAINRQLRKSFDTPAKLVKTMSAEGKDLYQIAVTHEVAREVGVLYMNQPCIMRFKGVETTCEIVRVEPGVGRKVSLVYLAESPLRAWEFDSIAGVEWN